MGVMMEFTFGKELNLLLTEGYDLLKEALPEDPSKADFIIGYIQGRFTSSCFTSYLLGSINGKGNFLGVGKYICKEWLEDIQEGIDQRVLHRLPDNPHDHLEDIFKIVHTETINYIVDWIMYKDLLEEVA